MLPLLKFTSSYKAVSIGKVGIINLSLKTHGRSYREAFRGWPELCIHLSCYSSLIITVLVLFPLEYSGNIYIFFISANAYIISI